MRAWNSANNESSLIGNSRSIRVLPIANWRKQRAATKVGGVASRFSPLCLRLETSTYVSKSGKGGSKNPRRTNNLSSQIVMVVVVVVVGCHGGVLYFGPIMRGILH